MPIMWQLYQPRKLKISRLTQNLLIAGLAVALIAVIATMLTSNHTRKVVKVEQTKMIVTGPVIPRSTTVQPTGGQTSAPVEPSGSTLTTTLAVNCPAATSFKAYVSSNGKNTITVVPPEGKTVHSTGQTPVITTYSGVHGTWRISDVTTGSTAGINWSSNGATCIQG